MTLTRSLRLALAALAAAAATTAALISTAGDAGARGTNCPEGKLCLWKHPIGEGKRVKIGGEGLTNKLAKKMNNQASSVYNNRDDSAVLYEKKNGNGESQCIGQNLVIADLADYDFSDVASSTRNANGDCPAPGPPR